MGWSSVWAAKRFSSGSRLEPLWDGEAREHAADWEAKIEVCPARRVEVEDERPTQRNSSVFWWVCAEGLAGPRGIPQFSVAGKFHDTIRQLS